MKTFTLFWLDGKSEIVTGDSPADAMNKAGYGNGALRALDFYSEGDKREEWEWNKESRSWSSKEMTKYVESLKS